MSDQAIAAESTAIESESAPAAVVPSPRRDAYSLYAEFYAMRLEAPAV